MDAEGGRVFPQERRPRMALVLAVQNLLVVACLVITLYVYLEVKRHERPQVPEDDVHIRLQGESDITRNGSLRFSYVYSNFSMSLLEGRKDKISLQCTGPYLLYLDVCYKNLSTGISTAQLQLRVGGVEASVSSFDLKASQVNCSGLHSTIYLRGKQEVSVHLFLNEMKIINMTVGLSYLLGKSVMSGEGALCDINGWGSDG